MITNTWQNINYTLLFTSGALAELFLATLNTRYSS